MVRVETDEPKVYCGRRGEEAKGLFVGGRDTDPDVYRRSPGITSLTTGGKKRSRAGSLGVDLPALPVTTQTGRGTSARDQLAGVSRELTVYEISTGRVLNKVPATRTTSNVFHPSGSSAGPNARVPSE